MNEKQMMTSIAMAQKTADKAQFDISAHERLCAERYENIRDDLGELKSSTAAMRKWVNIGMGVCAAIPTLIEIMQLLKGTR